MISYESCFRSKVVLLTVLQEFNFCFVVYRKNPFWTLRFFFFLAIPEMATWKEKLAFCESGRIVSISYRTSMVLPHLLSSLPVRRGGAPRVGQHQRVALVAGVRRGLGDGAPLQLAVRTGGHHLRRGHRLQGWHHALRDQVTLLRPVHLHGQQQDGPQHGHLYGRWVWVSEREYKGKVCTNVCSFEKQVSEICILNQLAL